MIAKQGRQHFTKLIRRQRFERDLSAEVAREGFREFFARDGGMLFHALSGQRDIPFEQGKAPPAATFFASPSGNPSKRTPLSSQNPN
jgi:hypothetical protein